MRTQRTAGLLRTGAAALVAGLSLIAAGASGASAAGGGSFSLEILVDGVPLSEYAARGRFYVEALEGREYSIRMRNRTPHRVAVALSVDGLNSIDAGTGPAWDATKWILEPRQSLTIDGWQTSPTTARRFFFTSETLSYGAWLGETRDLGLIAATVYRQRRVLPAPVWKKESDRERRSKSAPERLDAPAPESGAEAGALRGPSSEGDREAKALPDLSDDHAATGIGREVGHSVRRVHFEAERIPMAIVEVRYEYRDALVRLGIVPSHPDPCGDVLARRERSRGFDGMEFAPDPYRPPCR